ncbi:unannotated protein [freshwater metagenome]|uniref:Unannotated protein n=1 Tax=freshwater metagenome TaxID=449393 RepID=A0A6J7GV19_9ZZZZ
MRIPRPPPPAEALISTGSSFSVTDSGSSRVNTGTPASAIIFLDSTFEPIDSIAFTGGPIQVNPASSTCRANSAFSERNPYPGWTASAPACTAAAMINSPRK